MKYDENIINKKKIDWFNDLRGHVDTHLNYKKCVK